jgi:hypothetical protein
VSRIGATNRSAASRRTKDFIIYCLIAILIVTFIGLYGFYEGKLGHTSGLPVKWLGFGIMTAFVFGNTIRYSGPLWRVRKFWVLLGIFSVAHFVFGFLILSRISKIGLIHFAAITPIEYFALTAYLTHFLSQKNKAPTTADRQQ